MSLDLSLVAGEKIEKHICSCGNEHERTVVDELWTTNITHNLVPMFQKAGVYDILWHGNGHLAADQIPSLTVALAKMKAHPEEFKPLEPSNKWGTYSGAVRWLEEVITAFKKYPNGCLRCYR